MPLQTFSLCQGSLDVEGSAEDGEERKDDVGYLDCVMATLVTVSVPRSRDTFVCLDRSTFCKRHPHRIPWLKNLILRHRTKPRSWKWTRIGHSELQMDSKLGRSARYFAISSPLPHHFLSPCYLIARQLIKTHTAVAPCLKARGIASTTKLTPTGPRDVGPDHPARPAGERQRRLNSGAAARCTVQSSPGWCHQRRVPTSFSLRPRPSSSVLLRSTFRAGAGSRPSEDKEEPAAEEGCSGRSQLQTQVGSPHT